MEQEEAAEAFDAGRPFLYATPFGSYHVTSMDALCALQRGATSHRDAEPVVAPAAPVRRRNPLRDLLIKRGLLRPAL